jgi:hypothetical protein
MRSLPAVPCNVLVPSSPTMSAIGEASLTFFNQCTRRAVGNDGPQVITSSGNTSLWETQFVKVAPCMFEFHITLP